MYERTAGLPYRLPLADWMTAASVQLIIVEDLTDKEGVALARHRILWAWAAKLKERVECNDLLTRALPILLGREVKTRSGFERLSVKSNEGTTHSSSNRHAYTLSNYTHPLSLA
jgi:hypothetical protein